MKIEFKVIGRNIRELREERGMIQEEMAERVKMAAVYYDRIEKGERIVSLEQLANIAWVLKVEIAALLRGALVYAAD